MLGRDTKRSGGILRWTPPKDEEITNRLPRWQHTVKSTRGIQARKCPRPRGLAGEFNSCKTKTGMNLNNGPEKVNEATLSLLIVNDELNLIPGNEVDNVEEFCQVN
ncbi:hypothetical protein R1flu_008263 [Riccia fluitans]|uniref:Uncharacterized protein n=1 Tax=Riccia fluitans TaxID=41844 RepID=A0ABD1YBE9_9MARC